MNRSIVTKQNSHKSTLYRVVFDAVAVRYVVAFMFMFFVMHPAVPAFASEEVLEESADTVVEVSQPEPEIEAEVVLELDEEEVSEPESEDMEEVAELSETEEQAESEESTDETLEEAESPDTSEEVIPVEGEIEDLMETELDVAIEEEPEEIVETDSGAVLEENLDNASSTDSTETQTDDTETESDDENDQANEILGTDLEELSALLASTTEEAEVADESDDESTQDDENPEISVTDSTEDNSAQEDTEENENVPEEDSETSSDEDIEESIPDVEVLTTIASTSSTSVPVAEKVVTLSQESFVTNNYNAHQFADTECVSVGDGSFYCSQNETAPEYIEDRVFSAPDADGDTEIYVTINGKTTQITHNIVDDASPQYDGISDTIVWHSMQNDRFQIAQYDVQSGEVIYLTDTSYNNMEPVAYGDIVMWQAWIGDNWEIMILDNGEVVQLTDNEMHDITPQMRDGYIMWQTQFAEGWKVALYDEKTSKVNYIADSDGSKVANPRFVLVYDSTDKVGDVRTLGYDFGSGSSFTLGSLPAEMPEDIPEPDQTGETRALIQAKPSTREGEVDEIAPVPTSAGTTTPDVVVDGDLIIQPVAQATSTEDVLEEIEIEEPVELAPGDTDGSQVSEEDVSHIDDVVIPPFISTTTEEVG